jgi:hypothetical protein
LDFKIDGFTGYLLVNLGYVQWFSWTDIRCDLRIKDKKGS